jgi:hypothetical protein
VEVIKFDVLWKVHLPMLNDVLYNVYFRISERDRFPTWRRWLPIRPGHIRPEALVVATEVLEEIERRVAKPLSEIGQEEMRPLERAIHGIARERREREMDVDEKRAERLLEELRRDYGDVSRRVA